MNSSYKIKSFWALVSTHFLTVLNDNLYKFLLIYFLLENKTLEENTKILSLVSFCFAFPFIVLAPLAGSLSDKYRKRNIILITRAIEIISTFAGIGAFYFDSAFLGYTVLVVLAAHTAVFGPAKLGLLPEILPLDKLSQANGVMTAGTYCASILGAGIAPLLVDITKYMPNHYVWLGALCFIFSIMGAIAAFFIPYSNVCNPHQKIRYGNFSSIWNTLVESLGIRWLTWSLILSSVFLMVGSYTQIQIIPYVHFCLGLPKHFGGYLFPLVALGIGIGSYFAGLFSNKDIEVGFVPFSCFILGVTLTLLYFLCASVSAVATVLFVLGVGGGFFHVPIHAYVQYISPKHKRGHIIATANFLDFLGVLLTAVVMRFLGLYLQLDPSKSFFAVGAAIIMLAFVLLVVWKEPLYRLFISFYKKKSLLLQKDLFRENLEECFLGIVDSLEEVKYFLSLLPKTVKVVIVTNSKDNLSWKERCFIETLISEPEIYQQQLTDKIISLISKTFKARANIAFVFLKDKKNFTNIHDILQKKFPDNIFFIEKETSEKKCHLLKKKEFICYS